VVLRGSRPANTRQLRRRFVWLRRLMASQPSGAHRGDLTLAGGWGSTSVGIKSRMPQSTEPRIDDYFRFLNASGFRKRPLPSAPIIHIEARFYPRRRKAVHERFLGYLVQLSAWQLRA
jgi:hypothetical protein